jgi:hypothetical protein
LQIRNLKSIVQKQWKSYWKSINITKILNLR